MPPYVSYLVFGKVLNAIGDIVLSASLKVITSIGNKTYNSNGDGIFLFDLADVGYTSGETVTIDVTEPFNNELAEFTFVVTGFFHQENITLELRTRAVETTGYSPPVILHSVGKKPITADNPLPTRDITDPLREYGMAGVDDGNRLYGYMKTTGEWYIMDLDGADNQALYVRGTSSFTSNWANRANLTYQTFDAVFG